MKGLIHDTRGAALTVFLLILTPLLLMVIVYSAEIGMTESSARNLSDAVSQSTRSAASMVETTSQAEGNICINIDEAYYMFRNILCGNLGLNFDMTPKDGSRMQAIPDFQVLVYNGEEKYGQQSCVLFACKDGEMLPPEYLSLTGFPYTFGITDDGIVLSDTGVRNVTLEAPSVIGFVKGEIKPIIGSKGGTVSRWACARIVTGGEQQ